MFAADWYTDWYTKFNRYTNNGNYTMSEKIFDLSTVKGVQKIHHDGKDKDYQAGNGLMLRVRASSKTWIYRERKDGKTKVITIGTFPDISPTEAKREALELAKQSNAITANVKTLVEAYYAGMVSTKHKHPEQAKHYLDLIVAQFGNSTIRSVKRLELTTWLRGYSKSRPRAGDMMRSHLKKLFAYAVECGYIDNSPAEGITSNITGYVPKPKSRVLTDDEIRYVFALEHHNAPLLRFLLLTGLRISEAQSGYLDGDRWRIDDSKNGKAHWVHLPPLALRQLPLPHSTATNIQHWLKRLMIKNGYQADPRKDGYNAWTCHDLRRTFATRLNDAGIEPFVVEKCTNHTMEGVMAVYNRAEYETQRIEAAHKMQALVMQIITHSETN